MNDAISRQSVFDIVDELSHQMTIEGYWSMIERVKGLPSATCGNLEKPEIPQHSEGEAADCNLDCISRQMLLEYIHGEPVGKLLCDKYNLDGLIEQFPSVQPNLQPTCNQLATDCISRQAAIDILDAYQVMLENGEENPYSWARFRMSELPSAQQDCTECEEYDSETKSCPKYCDVIRRTLGEAKPEPHSGRRVYQAGYAEGFEAGRKAGAQEWIPCSERLPDDLAEVNITWVNHNPEPYYDFVKDKPATGTAVYYKGKWYWYSSITVDMLAEYGRYDSEEFDEAIECIAWMPLPEPYQEGES